MMSDVAKSVPASPQEDRDFRREWYGLLDGAGDVARWPRILERLHQRPVSTELFGSFAVQSSGHFQRRVGGISRQEVQRGAGLDLGARRNLVGPMRDQGIHDACYRRTTRWS